MLLGYKYIIITNAIYKLDLLLVKVDNWLSFYCFLAGFGKKHIFA